MTPQILTMLLGAATISGRWALSALNIPKDFFIPVFLLTILGTLACGGVLVTETLAVLEKKSK